MRSRAASLAALALIGLLTWPGVTVGAESDRLAVAVAQGRLSLEADRVPLTEILEAVAEEAGFAVELRGAIDELVSRSIVDRPLDLAIGEILGRSRYSFFLEFATADSPDQPRRLSKLVVISRSGGASGGAPAQRDTAADPAAPEGPEDPEAAAKEEAIDILEKLLRESDDSMLRDAAAEALDDLDQDLMSQ